MFHDENENYQELQCLVCFCIVMCSLNFANMLNILLVDLMVYPTFINFQVIRRHRQRTSLQMTQKQKN